MDRKETVSIRPQVTVLSVLKFIEYEIWYALAEFVDNAIDSYLKNIELLKELNGQEFKLEVKIEINDEDNKIVIRDNAAGIDEKNYRRAFRAAEIPADTSGLCEFGMGMKTAACWFSDEWSVRTTAIGETVEKTVKFDMKKIFEDKLEELDVEKKMCNDSDHYTVIELKNVSRIPRKRSLNKVKEHLKSIYREFIRNDSIILRVDDEILEYIDPKILIAPPHDNSKAQPILWKREIDFPIESNLSVRGFVAIREKASTTEAGFALFRRGRLIEGSYDNGFRPDFIFGNPNSFRYQRVFGELHLTGFDVTFTKKGIKWDNNLDMFLKLLKDDISTKSFPLLQQAENYRVRATEKEYKTAKKALDETVDDLEKKAPKAIADVVNNTLKVAEPLQSILTKTEKTIHREFDIRFNKANWRVSIELSYDPSIKELIELGDSFIKEKLNDESIRQIGIRLSLTHPFMVEHVGVDTNKIEPILRMAAAFGLSEVIAKGSKIVGDVRRNFNELILNISKQE